LYGVAFVRWSGMPYPFKKPITPKAPKPYSDAELKVWYEKYRSYEDRLREWRQLDRKVSNGILRKVHYIDGTIKCLSSKCDTVLTTANGMSYHLRMCSLESDEIKYRCPVCKEEMYVMLANRHICQEEALAEISKAFASRETKRLQGLDDDSSDSDEDLSDNDFNFNFNQSDNEDFLNKAKIMKKYFKSHPPKMFKRCESQLVGTSNEKIKDDKNVYSISFQHMEFSESAFPTMQCCLDEWRNFSPTHPNLHSSFYKSSVFMRYDNIQQYRRLKRLESVNTWAGAIGFTGSRISACAWCPSKSDIQYILVSLYVGSYDGLFTGPHQSILQLWAFDPQADSDSLKLNCVWNLVHNYGMVRCLKWCPTGIYEDKDTVKSDGNLLPRLGCFAASTSCGTVVIYCVPHPDCIPGLCIGNVFYRAENEADSPDCAVYPVLTLQTNSRRRVISLDWNFFDGHSRIAAGQENGVLSVWDLSALDEKTHVLKPFIIIHTGDWPLLQTFWFTREYVVVLNSSSEVTMWSLTMRDKVQHRGLSSVSADHILLHPYLAGLLFSKYSIRTNSSQLTMTMPFSDHSGYRYYSTHSDKVWSIAFSPDNVSIISADNEGTIASSGVDAYEADSEIDVQKTILITQVDILGDSVIRPYIIRDWEIRGRLRKCALTFSNKQIKGTPTVKVSKCKAQMLCGLSIDAIFWVDINNNENMKNWVCAGGENGFLHVISMENTDSSSSNELNIEGSSVEYTSEGTLIVLKSSPDSD
ncbi:General transcription factor 3C polypeptide 2, partial [Trichinella pseudospiralis]